MKASFVMLSPVGKLYVETEDEKLVKLEYHSKKKVTTNKMDRFSSQVKKQITNYFNSSKSGFNLPVMLNGTPFQKKVWRAMQNIPVGQTRTYGDISEQLQSSPRAVGNACRANPVPLVVPCHRIIGKAGIGGFGGKTAGRNIDCKSWLLKHELGHEIEHEASI